MVCLSCQNIGMIGKPAAQYTAHIRKLRRLKRQFFSGGFPASCILPEVLEKFLARRLNSMAWGYLLSPCYDETG